jgi:hypothetical protein
MLTGVFSLFNFCGRSSRPPGVPRPVHARAEAEPRALHAESVLGTMQVCRALLQTARARGEQADEARLLWQRVESSSEPTLVHALHRALQANG